MIRRALSHALNPGVVACASAVAVVAGPLYDFAQTAWFLRAQDAKALAVDAHPELPSKLAAIVNEARFREALGHEFSELAIDSLLRMPSIQLQTTLRLAWTLPFIVLLVVAAARRTDSKETARRSVGCLIFGLVLVNAAVGLNAVWMHGDGAARAIQSCLRALMVHTAMGTAYVAMFASLHHLIGRSTLKWLAASLGMWGTLWFVRMTLRSLESPLQHWLVGGVDTRLLSPSLTHVTSGLIACALWTLGCAALVYLQRRDKTRPFLFPFPRTSQGRS